MVTATRPVGAALVRVVLERFAECADFDSYRAGVGGTCYECPFASEPLDVFGEPAAWADIWSDPTEAYFRCHLPGRPPDVTWGEYAPCTRAEWTAAALAELAEVEGRSA